MFFDSVSEIAKIAGRCGTSIFVVPDSVDVEIKNALVLQPEEKSVITIEQVRQMLGKLSTKQTQDVFVVIRPADLLKEAGASAFLKGLDEPGKKVHFVLITANISQILPTILSRAEVYFLNQEFRVDKIACDDEKVKALAKRLIAARGAELVALADEMNKKKDDKREYALLVLGVAIEMLYKGYLINQKPALLNKIEKFLAAYENISLMGHIKLHLVADLC